MTTVPKLVNRVKSRTKTLKLARPFTRQKDIQTTLAGAWTGGIIPTLTYLIAHYQAPNLVDGTPWTPKAALWLAVIGGLAYSAPTVAHWFSRYSNNIKAWGFVASLETAMTITDYTTSLPALLTLVGINAWVLADKFKKTL